MRFNVIYIKQIAVSITLLITMIMFSVPLSCSSNETIVDKSLNVKMEKQIIIQKQDKEVKIQDHEKIPSNIADVVNKNFPVELDNQLPQWLQKYKNRVNTLGLSATEKKGIVLHRYALVKEANLNGNKSSKKQISQALIVIYQIKGNYGVLFWTLSVLKKEDNTFTKIWESPVNNIGEGYFGIDVRHLQDRTEILVYSTGGTRGAYLDIYKWEGNSARLVGKFTGDILRGGVVVNHDIFDKNAENEIIEGRYNDIKFYIWDGKEYKLYKTVEREQPSQKNK